MLNFPIELEGSTFVLNCIAFNKSWKTCAESKLPFKLALARVTEEFQHLDDSHFLELMYEQHEYFAMIRNLPRCKEYDFLTTLNFNFHEMLLLRNQPNWNESLWIQFFGKAAKNNVDINQAVNRMLGNGHKYLPRNKDHE